MIVGFTFVGGGRHSSSKTFIMIPSAAITFEITPLLKLTDIAILDATFLAVFAPIIVIRSVVTGLLFVVISYVSFIANFD